MPAAAPEAGRRADPARADVAMLLQMIVGAWPLELDVHDADGRAAFAERLAQWQEKALREAKLATDWAVPNEAYEAAARRACDRSGRAQTRSPRC